MNTLSFAFADSPRSGDHQVRPLVDGTDLLERFAGGWLGLDPPEFFRQPQLLSGGRLFIGRCGECGIVSCDWVAARVVRDEGSVTWELGDEQKFEFSPAEYLRTVESGATNTDWESSERTAARLVSSLDFTTIEQQGLRFEWASARQVPGCVSLSFWSADAPHQRLFDIAWDGQHPEDAAEQVKLWLLGNPAVSVRTQNRDKKWWEFWR